MNIYLAYTGKVLEEIFGTGILTPLEESDDYFSLEVTHLTFNCI